jgi:cyclomaltodextrinase
MEPWDAPPTYHGFKGGDLLGIAEHLDYLADLGITALYLNPIFASAANHRYHTYDFELVDPLLGGDAAFRELLDEAHSRGMRVILDGVFNHASRGFWPFNHVLENGAASPYRDWFYLDPEVLAGRRGLKAYPGKDEVEAMARERDLDTGRAPDGHDGHGSVSQRVLGYAAWWDLPALPKLNHANPAVREYILGVAQRWLRFGIDGWRLDVPEEIQEPGFWEEFRRRCREVHPESYIVGEIWRPAPEWVGSRFDAVMNYPLAEAILSFVGGVHLDLPLVARAVEYVRHVHAIDGAGFARQLQVAMSTYPPAATSVQLNLLDSHDTPRFLSMAGGHPSAARLGALIQMTLPGAPCIYYGDEVGLPGGHDPDCRRGYPWDPARQDTALRDFYAGLIELRRHEPALRRGRFEVLCSRGSAVAYALFADDRARESGFPAATPGSAASGSAAPSFPLAAPVSAATASGVSTAVGSTGHRVIIVAVNAGDSPVRLECSRPDLAGHLVERVSWKGRGWGTEFASRPLEHGLLTVDLGSREGVVIGAKPAV